MKGWSPFIVSILCASVAFAEPPAPASSSDAASALVQKQLLAPLKKAESRRSRFSRVARAPAQRRVRVLDQVAQTDVRGKLFVRFAIDVRDGWDDDGEWQTDAVLGCAYPHERQVFVQRGETYVPAGSALGADAKPRPDVCRAAPAGSGA